MVCDHLVGGPVLKHACEATLRPGIHGSVPENAQTFHIHQTKLIGPAEERLEELGIRNGDLIWVLSGALLGSCVGWAG